MKKSNPTLTVSMSMTQEDMNSLIRQKMDKAQKDVVESQKRRDSPEHIRQILAYLNQRDPQDKTVDIAIGVGNYLYLNMITKSFCESEEELEAEIKHNRGYVRALNFMPEYDLIAGGGYFSPEQARKLAGDLISKY